MKKQEIIDIFLKKGIQLDSSALEELHRVQSRIAKILEKIDKEKAAPKTITLEILNSLLSSEGLNIEVIKKPVHKKGKVTPQDYADAIVNRYEKISKILVKKLSLLNLMSLGKINQKTRNFSVIGMVKEKDIEENTITIEDQTGELTIHFEEMALKEFKEIILDEVLGVICEKKDTVRAKKTIWPDIPLRKLVNKTKNDVFCIFVSDLHMDDENFNKKTYENFLDWANKEKHYPLYIFVLGGVSSRKKDVIDFFNILPKKAFKVLIKGEKDPDTDVWDLILPNPSFIRIENDVSMFLSHGEFLADYTNLWKELPPAMAMQNLLKKRHLNPVFEFNTTLYDADPFLIDTIPDIFVAGHVGSASLVNYKGVSIMTTGSFTSAPIFWLINLKTRETIKLDFT